MDLEMLKSTTFKRSLRRILRPTLPKRSPGAEVAVAPVRVHGANCLKRAAQPWATMSADDIPKTLSVVLRSGRIALPTSPSIPPSAVVGSTPFSGDHGEPLWNVRNVAICQPPNTWPAKLDWPRKNGNSYTKLTETRWGRS